MNNLNNDDASKIDDLKKKLYSRSIASNASKLNPLRQHSINVPTSWEAEKTESENTSNNNLVDEKNSKESISNFLNKKFESDSADNYSEQRSVKINDKLDRTTASLKIAQAELNSKNTNTLYPNLQNNQAIQEEKPEFQSDYHPDIKTIKIGEYADMQGYGSKNIPPKKRKLGFSLTVLTIVFIFFIGAFVYSYINISKGVNTVSTNKIDIKITGPVSVKSGETTEFVIDITNNNNSELILSDLVIQYPDGTKSPQDKTQDLRNERISIGTIKPGETIRQKNSLVLFGEQNVKKNINYSYQFNINESATIFKTEKDVGVFISGSPINIVISNVKEINNNQELDFDINLSSNTEEILKNIQLKVEYPFGYRLLESSQKPIFDNNTWSFDTIDPLASTTIKIKGKFVGEVNVDKNFRFILGIEDSKTKDMVTVLYTQDSQVSIRKPFVVTRLLLDGDTSDVKNISYNQNLRNDLIITNNLPDSITDVVVEVLLGGVLIDRRSINSNDGFYDSSKDIVFWDKTLSPDLIKIPPGESRELDFNLNIIAEDESLLKTLRRTSSELTINVKAQRLNENRVPENIIASTKKQLRLKTSSNFISNTSYVRGVYSPEVNKETVFRYVGNITNTANTINNVNFVAKLPPNSVWKSSYSTNIPPASVRYNQSTREINISLGDVEAGAGIDKPIKEFYFDIGFTPTLTQSGQTPTIVIDPSITATDTFTGEKINIKNNSITTDVTVGENSDVDSRVK